MIGEINIDGIFISPLLLCLVCAFFLRMMLSALLNAAGVYRLIAQRPLFDTALFLILTGLIFYGLKLLTTP
ncbi:DUF1656 domain-containing protein [Mixta theicola]|uniref:DUF1656 domain-containing protein n=1 Tax=Mixta theicola TaxID=1458355 RepID=A0A2K1QE30_9GAMM|nr:DUF1656 domain-containing protein [Mixta theicola]PNS13266.1 DUF1656 domain-containing protein [Mixta theicola]GLR08986.1 hypothetical protein GCM10007905_17060 [Mixta theicola]